LKVEEEIAAIFKEIEESDEKLFSSNVGFIPGKEISSIITEAFAEADINDPRVVKRMLLQISNALVNDTLELKEHMYGQLRTHNKIKKQITRIVNKKMNKQPQKKETKLSKALSLLKWFFELGKVQAAIGTIIIMFSVFIAYHYVDGFKDFIQETGKKWK